MQAYHVTGGKGIESLKRVTLESKALGPYDVRVRVHAVSLNFRDLMVADGIYLKGSGAPVIPASDMAGVVAAVGERVTRFRVGDRVMGAFMPDWVDGEPTPAKTALAPGAATDGVLAEEAVYAEHGLVATPAGLSDEEAATLPCAAVTAWNALFVGGRAQAARRRCCWARAACRSGVAAGQGRRPAGHRHLVQQPQAGTGARTGRGCADQLPRDARMAGRSAAPDGRRRSARRGGSGRAGHAGALGGRRAHGRHGIHDRRRQRLWRDAGAAGGSAAPSAWKAFSWAAARCWRTWPVSFRSPASSPRSTGSLASTRRRPPSRTWRPAAISARW